MRVRARRRNQRTTLVEVVGFPPPMTSWSRRTLLVVDECRARGHQCLLVNIGPSRKLKDPRYINIRGPVHYLLKITGMALRRHVVHTHTNAKGMKGTLMALMAHLICRVFLGRCVLTFHAGVVQDYFPKTGKRRLDLIMWLLFKTPHEIICNSADVKERIVADYGIDPERVHPIPAFCEAYMQTEIGALPPEVEEFAANHDPIITTYISTCHAEFAFDQIVESLARLRYDYPRLGLVVMGTRECINAHARRIDELGVREHIVSTGVVDHAEFLAILRRGSLFLRTPEGDGVAASVLEALWLEVPVVASDNGTRPGGCVLFRNLDLEDMVSKISQVLQSPKEQRPKPVRPEARDTLSEEVEVLLPECSTES